jgi:hypothetical protein
MAQSKFSIVRKIAELLKMGDQGKLDSFVSRVVKTLKREIAGLEKNLEVKKLSYNQEIEDLQDKLADAQEALENSYLQIDVDKIKTNEEQTAYVDVYLNNIDSKVQAVSQIEKLIEAKEKEFAAFSEDTERQIVSLSKRISALED